MIPIIRTIWILITLCPCMTGRGMAEEVQRHGLWFEHWLCDSFFGGYRAMDYTQKWDIPAAVNREHGGLPVNPKAVQFGSSIGLGDALRQREVSEPFLLAVAFWEQEDADSKRWVNVQVVRVTPEQWERLWHPLTSADLQKLMAVIEDRSLSLEEARTRAQAIKSRPPFSEAIITLNPKIDRSQRRLQCSLSFRSFFDHLAPQTSRERQPAPSIWGKQIPVMRDSKPRNFPVK